MSDTFTFNEIEVELDYFRLISAQSLANTREVNIMTVLDRMPTDFWEESQNIFMKYKKGDISLDECLERQRQCLPRNKKISKVDQDDKRKTLDETKKNDNEKKSQKKSRADAIFEKIRARSEKAKKEEEETSVVKEELKKVDNKAQEEITNSTAPYNCEECLKKGKDYSCNVLNLFEGHIKMKHTFYQPFKCEKCDFKSNRKANLNRHLIKYHKN